LNAALFGSVGLLAAHSWSMNWQRVFALGFGA
jgi:hypothetical protein